MPLHKSQKFVHDGTVAACSLETWALFCRGNGREDFDLPYTTAQVPMFRMLGTAAADKRHAVLEGGHLPPRPQEVYKEILDWLDRYLVPRASAGVTNPSAASH
jgi:hypothetical protein